MQGVEYNHPNGRGVNDLSFYWGRIMEWFNPLEWLAWLYGKFFQNHSWIGGTVVVGAFGIIGLFLWVRAVDKYKEEHPDPKPQAVAENNASTQQTPATASARELQTHPSAKIGKKHTRTAKLQTHPPTPATQRTAEPIKIVGNAIGGTDASVAPWIGCKEGKRSDGRPCAKDLEIRENTFLNLGGGETNLLPQNSSQSLVEHNRYITNDPSARPTITLNGEDTVFRNNTVENENVTVAPEARRLEIKENIFRADVLAKEVSDGVGNDQLEAVLSNIRSVFQENWKSLPAETYKANDLLLAQFEANAREKPFDRAKTEASLQKVIDSTKQQ
jgi:hypothetical protein